jgi:hypothetical protein
VRGEAQLCRRDVYFQGLTACARAAWMRGLKKGTQHLAAQVEILFDDRFRIALAHLQVLRARFGTIIKCERLTA